MAIRTAAEGEGRKMLQVLFLIHSKTVYYKNIRCAAFVFNIFLGIATLFYAWRVTVHP